eukprot:177485-Rhodomonas_salina.1
MIGTPIAAAIVVFSDSFESDHCIRSSCNARTLVSVCCSSLVPWPCDFARLRKKLSCQCAEIE